MLALIAEVNDAMLAFAPLHIRRPEKTMLRIYRDTRFSASKLPYKTHLSAWWLHHYMPKTSGAGFYMHISADELVIAAGVFMPTPEQLLAIRRHLVTHHASLRRLLAGKTLRRLLPEFETNSLSRPPKGFCADHPAIDLVRARYWGLSATLPAAAALTPKLLREVVTRFRAAAPVVDWLNAPLTSDLQPAHRHPVFPLRG
jgi:uncharacterized protein (TIGR02453 family)